MREEFVAKKQIKQDKQELMNCLRMKRGILRLRVNCSLKFRIYRTRSTPCQMREKFMILKQRAPLERSTFPVNLYYSESQDHALPRFWIAARYTEYCGYFRKRFWMTTCLRRTNLYSLQQFKEFGILFSRIETWFFWKYKEAREWTEKRTAEFVNTCTALPKWRSVVNSYWWNLFSWWYDWLPEISDLGNASWKIPGLVAISKLESHITMHWIKEVEIAESIDELMTSRSKVRHDLPDFDMLDAMIASASKKLLNTQIHFRKRVSVEEQRAQKHDRFLRGRQIIYWYFRASGAYEEVQGLSTVFASSL